VVVLLLVVIVVIMMLNSRDNALTDFPSHIHPSPFAVSVHTLQSPIYTSSSPSPIPSCQWPVDGCPTAVDVFLHRGEVRMIVCSVRNGEFL
jgi:hypothetical protein